MRHVIGMPVGFVGAVELLASGRLPLDLLIDADDATLDTVLDAMLECERGERPAKVMVRPEVTR